MTDWRLEAGYTRYPEDNNVIGVPIDAERHSISQAHADLLTVSMMEVMASDAYTFAKLMGEAVFMTVTISDMPS